MERQSAGIDPTQRSDLNIKVPAEFTPKCLTNITGKQAKKYYKIRNVFTYSRLNLPITNLYTIDDQDLIAAITLGNIPADLKEDLSVLVKGSLVIRMDIETDDINQRQLLPSVMST